MSTAVIGGGCFWCLEAVFNQVKGVMSVVSGYAGGDKPNPSYEDTHRPDNKHAEVVRITFDPAVITYRKLLEIFFTIHDPTTPNRQGNDVGVSYRSIILFSGEDQRQTAADVIRTYASKLWGNPIVTELKPLDKFWPAEEYHQNYFAKNPSTAYCQAVINPKLAELNANFASKLKA